MLALLERTDGYDKLLTLLKPTEHRVLPVPTFPQVLALARQANGDALVYEIFAKREKLIQLEKEDPFHYGMVLQPWRDADELLEECMLLAVYGGNRASKTEYGAWKGVQKLVKKAVSQVLWLHESEQSSIDVQQLAVAKYIPGEWKNLKKTSTTNISYSRKNGFSDNKFVFPNGAVGKFGSYKQTLGDYEGPEYDLIIADENLPLAWLRTLLVRLATRAGKFIWSYTPIHGLTPAGKEVTDGAVTLKSRPVDPELLDSGSIHVEDCPKGHMPYIQRSSYSETRIIYFHSDLNPYAGYPTLKKILLTFDTEGRKRRGYGYARNTIMTLFPKFGAGHVIEPERIPGNITRYQIADPAGARNMFMIWVGVDEAGRHYVYREWPTVAGLGEWAVSAEDNRNWDGVPGPAQPTLGYGVKEYKELILKLEGNRYDGAWEWAGETVEQRFMDPRSGAAQSITETQGGSSLMDRMRDEQVSDKGMLAGPCLDFHPAKGLREDEGIKAITDLLSYDKTQPITALVNEPKLFIAKSCENTIWALKNYTGHDGERAACKDPIDCLRYMATEKLEWLDPKRPKASGGGSY